MILRRLLLTIFLIMILTSVSLGKKQTLKQGYLVVTVDGLRVRLEPNLYSDIIKNLKKGDKVFFTGKRGKKSYKVILNSKYHITPFLQVDCLDGKTGWVYAGGLLDMNRVKLKVDVNKNFTGIVLLYRDSLFESV